MPLIMHERTRRELALQRSVGSGKVAPTAVSSISTADLPPSARLGSCWSLRRPALSALQACEYDLSQNRHDCRMSQRTSAWVIGIERIAKQSKEGHARHARYAMQRSIRAAE